MKKIYVITGLLTTLLLASLTGLAQTQSRSDLLKELEAKRAEIEALEKIYLEPSAEDRATYTEFLQQPNTGLMRLLPREKFDSEVYREIKETLTVRGGGSYYSFTKRTHEYDQYSDLSLERGYLQVGFAGANYGFMVTLGDVPIETVNSETPGVTFFAAYRAPREEQLARQEYYRLSRGVVIDKLPVARSQTAALNTTYLLRSINFGASDVMVALRVVRIDSDGSMIIAWKILKQYESPKLNPSQPKDVG